MCFHRVDIHCGQTGVGEGLADHAFLRGTVRCGQAVGRTVLIHRGAADHGQDRVPVALGVGKPFEDEHPGALTPAGAVGTGRERLAPAVGGEPALAAELDERRRRRHHGHPTGQREIAFAGAQRLCGQVRGDQRGRTRGVYRDGRALQAQRVRHPAGHHARLVPREQEPFESFRRRGEA